jgi:hypothetical protein
VRRLGNDFEKAEIGVTRSRRTNRLAKRAAGTLLLSVVYALLAPSPAWAGCVHGAGSSSATIFRLYQFDEQLITGALSASERAFVPLHSDSDSAPRDRPAPCSGPGCSGRAPLPVPAPSIVQHPSDRCLASIEQTAIGMTEPPIPQADEPNLHPIGRHSSIFHPPRS